MRRKECAYRAFFLTTWLQNGRILKQIVKIKHNSLFTMRTGEQWAAFAGVGFAGIVLGLALPFAQFHTSAAIPAGKCIAWTALLQSEGR